MRKATKGGQGRTDQETVELAEAMLWAMSLGVPALFLALSLG